jgi:CheY-like chemotaxis protein
VLVVEEDDATRELLVTALAHDGYDVVEAVSGEDAIRSLEHLSIRDWSTRPVDLVLIEARMSGVGGVRIGDMIRSVGWPIPLILMSSVEDADVDRAAARLKAQVLAKPVRLEVLRRVVLSTLAAQARPAPADVK